MYLHERDKTIKQPEGSSGTVRYEIALVSCAQVTLHVKRYLGTCQYMPLTVEMANLFSALPQIRPSQRQLYGHGVPNLVYAQPVKLSTQNQTGLHRGNSFILKWAGSNHRSIHPVLPITLQLISSSDDAHL